MFDRQLPLIRRIWPWMAAALSGVLITLCFAPWNCGWLGWVALIPLICAVWFSGATGRGAWRRRALLGYVAGIIFFATTFSWLGALGTLFAELWLHGLPVILALYLGLYFAFWAWFIGTLLDRAQHAAAGQPVPGGALRDVHQRARWENARPFLHSHRNLLTALLGAAAWVTHEWIRGWLFSGFGWNSLGVSLRENLAMIQIVDITGVAGLSFLTAFCNLMAVIVVRRMIAEFGPLLFRRVRWEFSVTVALVTMVFAYGAHILVRARPRADTVVRVAAVQPNTPQSEKFSGTAEDRIFERLSDLTALAASTLPDLLIWPEAATPRGMFADEVNYRFVLDQAARGEFGFLFGTVDAEPTEGEAFNVAMLLTDQGKTIQSYRKVHLVPFGEYLPFRRSFPLFAMIAGELVPGDFASGKEFTIMELSRPGVRLSALICFEDTLGNLTRRFVQNGAQLLVNLTNDGWFGTTSAAEQHVGNALFRAIENRRPLVRCANTGVTCAIDQYGRVDRWLPPFARGFVAREVGVPSEQKRTFYTRHGDWLALVCATATGVRLLIGMLRKKTR